MTKITLWFLVWWFLGLGSPAHGVWSVHKIGPFNTKEDCEIQRQAVAAIQRVSPCWFTMRG